MSFTTHLLLVEPHLVGWDMSLVPGYRFSQVERARYYVYICGRENI